MRSFHKRFIQNSLGALDTPLLVAEEPRSPASGARAAGEESPAGRNPFQSLSHPLSCELEGHFLSFPIDDTETQRGLVICLSGVTQQGHQRVQTETWVFWNPQGHSPEHQRLISPILQILFFVVFKELL